MNTQEHLTVCASEEAGEVAEIAFEIGKVALKFSKDLHKALRFGFGDTDPASGKTKLEMLVAELNDLQACVEMLQENGVVLVGLGDQNAIAQKKARVNFYMKTAAKLGTISEIPVPRPYFPIIQTNPLFASQFKSLSDRHGAMIALTKKLNPEKQQDFAGTLIKNIELEIQKEFPEGSCLENITETLTRMTAIKDETISNFIRKSIHYNMINKKYLDMIDITIDITVPSNIKFIPNEKLLEMLEGKGAVNLCAAEFKDESFLYSQWLLHKREIDEAV